MYKQLLLIILLIIPFCGSKSLKNDGCLQMDIILLTDLSGSIGGNEEFISNASRAFIERFDLNPNGIKVSLIAFSSDVVILNNLTSEKEELLNSLVFIENNPIVKPNRFNNGINCCIT